MRTPRNESTIKAVKKPAGVPLRTATKRETPIAGFEIGDGLVAYDPDMSKATDQQLGCLLLASFGSSNGQIASNMSLSVNTVKTCLEMGTARENIPNQRIRFARHFFDNGIFRLIKPAESFLPPQACKVVEQVYEGKTIPQAASSLHLAPDTINTHLKYVSRKTGWRGRVQIVLAALVSREIDNYPIYPIDLSQPTSWTPEGGLIVPAPAEPVVPMPRQEIIHEQH